MSLQPSAENIRRLILKLGTKVQVNHLGTSLGCVELCYCLYKRLKNNGDRFILSKGHASAAFYVSMIEFGDFDYHQAEKEWDQEGGRLLGHVSKRKFKNVDWSTGALGHGAGVATGMAMASPHKHVFVLLSDGEINCGTSWETLFFVSKKQIANITFIVDQNNLQGLATEKEVLNLNGKICEMANILNFYTQEIDGHQVHKIESAIEKSIEDKRPGLIIASTVKGKGVPSIEGKVESHYKSGSEEFYKEYEALK